MAEPKPEPKGNLLAMLFRASGGTGSTPEHRMDGGGAAPHSGATLSQRDGENTDRKVSVSRVRPRLK